MRTLGWLGAAAAATLAACGSGTARAVPEPDPGDPVIITETEAVASDPSTTYTPSTSTGTSGTTPAPAAVPYTPPASSTSTAQGYAPYDATGTIQVRRIGQWPQSGIRESRRVVIRDANTWQRFWQELGAGGSAPLVDFTRDVVVAAALGQRQSGGYEVQIRGTNDAGGQATIEVVEIAPGPACMVTQAITYPVDVVVLPVSQVVSWGFVERREERRC